MAGRNIRTYTRGKLIDHIDFDPSYPFSTAGGYGEIYRGSLIRETRHDGSPRGFSYVALKSMRCGTNDNDTRLEQIIDEAAVWKALDHPHVLRFLGFLFDNDVTYLVSPFAAHGSLPQYLVLNPYADRPMFLAQMAAGLAYLHKMGIVHGDVKGANVLVFDGPSARICDFGLAKVADQSPGTTQNTAGSWYWMSPERMFGQTRTPASDVYAFGLTIYQTLSGNIPYDGLDLIALVQAVHVREERPPTQPSLSASGASYALLWTLATSCWSRLPEGRPSMEDAAKIIADSIGELVDEGHDDLPVVLAPSPPVHVTTHQRNLADRLPEPKRANDVSDDEARPHSTEKDHKQNNHGSNRTKARRLMIYGTAMVLFLGSVLIWFVWTQGGVPRDTSLFVAEATQDTWSSRKHKAEVDAVVDGILQLGRNAPKSLAASQGNAAIKHISSVLPAGPDILFGREEYIEDVVDRLCNTSAPGDESQLAPTPPRIVILGPGGIGKTTVALAAVSNHRAKAVYGDRVHWVPCEQATSPELLIELIARGFGAPKGKESDRKRDIINFLQQPPTQPRLLLLDNFETPWDIPTRQSEINDILYDIASASPLSILLTMRSDLPPLTRIRWTTPILPPLTALLLPAARELYLDIHEDAHDDANLDPLLQELAYMPLAVKLMANRGRLGEMPSALLALWKDERVRTKLLHQGDDRIASVMVSIELSVNSNVMRQNPDALTLLSVLAELPGGARREFFQELTPWIADVGGALGTLRQAALVQANASAQAVQLLSPVRLLILENHRASPGTRTSLRQTYLDFFKKLDREGRIAEAANIEAIFLDALDANPTETWIDTVYNYINSQFYGRTPVELIEKAVVAARKLYRDPVGRLPHGLQMKARVYYALGRYGEAMDAVKQSLVIYKKTRCQIGEANSLRLLADIYDDLGQLEDAVEAMDQAALIYKKLKRHTAAAKCLREIGSIYTRKNRYPDAAKAGEKQLVAYKQVGDAHGQVETLSWLWDVYRRLKQYDAAVEAVEQAEQMLFLEQHDGQYTNAGQLHTLGSMYEKLGRLEEAVRLEEWALEISEKSCPQCYTAGEILVTLGVAYRKLGRYNDAAGAGERASEIFKQRGSVYYEARSLAHLGVAYKMLGRYKDAVAAGERASILLQQSGVSFEAGENYLNLGDTYRVLGYAEDAVRVGEQALVLFKEIGDYLNEAGMLDSEGRGLLEGFANVLPSDGDAMKEYYAFLVSFD